ncbi:unnamed protein product [Calypogeia fissa]
MYDGQRTEVPGSGQRGTGKSATFEPALHAEDTYPSACRETDLPAKLFSPSVPNDELPSGWVSALFPEGTWRKCDSDTRSRPIPGEWALAKDRRSDLFCDRPEGTGCRVSGTS